MWLPTGFGKSIYFQALPLVYYFDYKLNLVSAEKKSVVIIIAPLIALMIDQVQSLRAKKVRAVVVSSRGCREGRVPECLLATRDTLDSASLVFCSPEALIEDKWRDALEKPGFPERVCAVAVDEAHCVSKWYVN